MCFPVKRVRSSYRRNHALADTRKKTDADFHDGRHHGKQQLCSGLFGHIATVLFQKVVVVLHPGYRYTSVFQLYHHGGSGGIDRVRGLFSTVEADTGILDRYRPICVLDGY